MSVAEMKKKIHEEIDHLEENKLKLVTDFLEQLGKQPETKLSVMTHALEIMKEREKVLEKLAQ